MAPGRHPLLRPFQWFFRLEAAGSIFLLFATLAALVLANSAWADLYDDLWLTTLGIRVGELALEKALLLWVNDGLMAVFFLVVGLEIKRELLVGELRDPRRAALPIGAAVGGMVFPALLYLALNGGLPSARGWGIPMATDIAFALGALALLGSRAPVALRVFLAAAAIVDDLGAVLVIAVFYTPSIAVGALGVAGVVVLGLLVLMRTRVQSPLPYVLLGVVLWVAVLKSGVHATIAGVVLAATVPHRTDHGAPLLERMEHALLPWVTYLVMPVFAFANAGVALGGADLFGSRIALGIVAGLLLGKQLGILGVPYIMVRLGWARLPRGVSWVHMHGVAWLAGIGFTMALFIAGLALPTQQVTEAKIGILAASALAGVLGLLVLRMGGAGPTEADQPPPVPREAGAARGA